MSNNQAGKGDKPRPTNKTNYNANFDGISGLGKMSGKPVKSVKGKITYTYR